MPVPLDWDLPPQIRARLSDRPGRQRTMYADGHLLLILHRVPQPGKPEREGVFYWRDASGEWRGSGGRTGVQGVRQHIEEYEKHVDKLETEFEEAGDAEAWHSVMQSIVPLHRAVLNLHGTMQSAREAVPEDANIISFRDRADDMHRAIELLHSDVQNAMSFAVARQAEVEARASNELARAGHRLNILAALFLPVTTLAAIFGMNLSHGLGEGAGLFWLIVVAGASVGLMIASTFITERAATAAMRRSRVAERQRERLRRHGFDRKPPRVA